jgi:hypothetical protein
MLFSDGNVGAPELCTAWQLCKLCDLIRRAFKGHSGDERDVGVGRVGSALIMKHNGKRILRLCSDLGEYLRSFTIIS